MTKPPEAEEPHGRHASPGRAGPGRAGAAPGRPSPGGRPGSPGRPAPGRSAEEHPPAESPSSGGDSPEDSPDPRSEEDEAPKPPSLDDELKALGDRGGDDTERQEAIQAKLIAERVAQRLQRDPSGMRIGNVALFNGSVNVGGGLNFTGPGGGGAAGVSGVRRIDVKRLTLLVETYLRPPGFDAALEILWEHRLLVLAIRQGTGRQAAALNLLAEALAMGGDAGEDGEFCYHVTDTGAIADLDWKPPTKGSGYLVLLDGAATDFIDEQWLASKADQLRETQSFMVVVTSVPRGALVEAAAHGGHVVTSLGDVDPLRIVERHVLGADPETAAQVDLHRRLKDSGAVTLLSECPEPQIAVRVAMAISNGEDLEKAVQGLRDPTGQVHAWFSQNRDIETLCMAIAAAVLEDVGYLSFSDAAVKLHDGLVGGVGTPPDLRLWEQLSAGHPWIEVEFGDSPASTPPRVRFRNPLVQQAVLGYMWTYLDGRRSAILAWLRELVTDPDIGVRARAAVAAGVIAWSDHGHAVHRYLRPWAADGSFALREGAATALAVMGSNPDLTEAAWRLIESWVEDAESTPGTHLSSTAVAAVGGSLGSGQPERALTLIGKALEPKDWETVLPATLSIARLIELGCASEVLQALLKWSEPQDASPMVTKALGVFVTVACAPPTDMADEYAGILRPSSPVDSRTPLLVRDALDHLPGLAELWARALARKPAQSYALESLRECLSTYADHDRTALRGIKAILLEVAARPGRHRERLDWYLGEWADDPDHPSPSAAQIHNALGRLE